MTSVDFVMAAMNRRLILAALLLIGLGALAWVGASRFSFAELAEREAWLRAELAAHPLGAWLIGFLVYFLAALVPGTRGKAIACGWLFGFWPALILVNGALTAAACVTFLGSRYIVGDAIQSRYGAALYRVNQLLERDGAWYVILLRILPSSFSLTNYLLGATRLNTRTFWWSTQLGLLPGNIVFVFCGARIPSLRQLAEEGVWALFSWELALGLTVLSLFPLVLHAVARHWGQRFRLERAAQPPGV